MKKGTKLYIEGRLQTRSWEQDGVKRYTTEIVASEMQMLDSRGGGGGGDNSFGQDQGRGGSAPAAKSSSTSAAPQAAPANFDNFDDDIPF